MKIDLFVTCLNDALFPKTGRATVAILERLGHSVAFDPRQTCCGQMHLNTGYPKEALKIVRTFLEVFEDAEVVVAPSGSCVGMIREMFSRAAEWSDDGALMRRCLDLAPRVFELSEFLVNKLEVADLGAYYPHRVVYHPTCHSLRLLNVGDAPLLLLRNVKDLELVELENADQCCGFGGTFSVKNPETSTAMLEDKLSGIIQARAHTCVAGDNSCLMHIRGGLSRHGETVEAVHLAEILANRKEEPFI